MENDILELLKNINDKLDKHTEILNNHTQILGEHTQILRVLEHASEVHRAEIDKVNYAIARVEGEVKGIREDLTAVEMITSKNWNDISKLKAVK
ncbi:hypothetical protein HBE96_21080 [Clostridium sp. P21]|uniref:Plasmid-related protein n=1 Tax=Clostridium muellerianum TaxID=2716538 RepID=A0A7Y0EKD0_9CLOT|nr:hypothetical protein [Clostridium muellerianum]NMM65081.1 hypothetical protein [Clostridium muellerianum]